MRDDLLRQLDLRRDQKRRPVHRMKTDNLLPHRMNVSRPKFPELRAVVFAVHKSDSAHVTRQRVIPHIENVLRIIRPGNSPLDRLPANGNILQPALNKTLHFVETEVRIQKLRIILVEVEQLLLIGRKPKEIILFGNKLPWTSANLAVRRLRRI